MIIYGIFHLTLILKIKNKQMKHYSIFLIIFCVFLKSYSQKIQNISLTTEIQPEFNNAYFFHPDSGVILSNSGYIFRTNNGADSIRVQNKLGNNAFGDVIEVGSRHLMLSTQDIYESTDRGNSWKLVYTIPKEEGGVPIYSIFYRFYKKNDSVIFALGFVSIIKSSDYGKTWKRVAHIQHDMVNDYFFAMHFVADTGYVWGRNGFSAKSTNNGETWSKFIIPDKPTIGSVSFLTPLMGYAGTAESKVLSTIDGGKTWKEIYSQDETNYFQCIHFKDSLNGYALSTNNFMITSNGGFSWILINLNRGTSTLRNIYFFNDSLGYIVGSKGYYFKTTDGGLTWKTDIYGAPEGYRSMHFINDSVGFVGFDKGRMMRTSNGGKSWHFVKASKSLEVNTGAMQFTDSLTGFMVSKDSMYKTSNGGTTWRGVPSALKITAETFIHFPSADTGFAGTNFYGDLQYTYDGGETWNLFFSIFTDLNTAYDIFFFNGKDCYVGAGNGILLRSSNFPDNWTELNIGEIVSSRSLWFKNIDTGIVATVKSIFKTTNGGSSWEVVKRCSSSVVQKIEIDKEGFGYIYFTYDSLLVTYDYGKQWNMLHLKQGYNSFMSLAGRQKIVVINQKNISMIDLSHPVHLDSFTGGSFQLVAGDSVAFDVSYNENFQFGAGNRFVAELSDREGNFNSPRIVGTLQRDTGGVITANLPASIQAGSLYRLRVASTHPRLVSEASEPFEIKAISGTSIEQKTTTEACRIQYTNNGLTLTCPLPIQSYSLLQPNGVIVAYNHTLNTNQLTLPTGSKPAGIYLLRYQTLEGSGVEKVIMR